MHRVFWQPPLLFPVNPGVRAELSGEYSNNKSDSWHTGKPKIYSLSLAQPFPGSFNPFGVQIGFQDQDMCHLKKDLRQLKTCHVLRLLFKNMMRIVCVNF
jgi:hypothetical protein